jgi:hypothetical protein
MNSFVLLHIIQGWRQKEEGSEWNGCQELRELFKAEFDKYSRTTLDIKISRWDADFETHAQELALLRSRYKVPRENFGIGLFPYSFGVGHGVPSCGKAYQRYGFDVDICVPSDGIFWRDDFLLGFFGNWTALFGDARIKFPDNIMHTVPFCQRINHPQGRGIATTQTMEPMVHLPYIHTEMDNAPEWHLRCVEAANWLVREHSPSKNIAPAAPTVEKVQIKLKEEHSQ